ncbi:MAG: hypothetical protein PHV77_06960 [Candidatus Omnitrophica bacterium]|nr:hypothetical protein [Candidatus Omnitrophota bacterium]
MISIFYYFGLKIFVHIKNRVIAGAFDKFISQTILNPDMSLIRKPCSARDINVSIGFKDSRAPVRGVFSESIGLQLPDNKSIFTPCRFFEGPQAGVYYNIFSGIAVIRVSENADLIDVVFFTKASLEKYSDVIFRYIFSFILEGNGFSFVHASGVAKGGKAVIFPAAAGGGKSTIAMALLLSGFEWIGDEHAVFKLRRGRTVDISPSLFALTAGLRREALSKFSRLQGYKDGFASLAKKNKTKMFLSIKPDFLITHAQLKATVFPRITDERKSRIKKIRAKETAECLLASAYKERFYHHGGMFLKDRYQALLGLASKADNYRMYLGTDSQAWAGIISSVINR